MQDFKGRSLLSKPLDPLSLSNVRFGGATHVLAALAIDKNGLPINFGSGGGTGTGDMSKAIIMKYDQVDVSNTWVITHNMNCYPSVRVDDGQGNAGIPDVDYVSKNELRILLGRATAGSAYLNRYPNVSLAGGNGEIAPADLNYSDPNNLIIDLSPEDLPPSGPGITNVDFLE